MTEPVTELDPRYGDPDAGPIPWDEVRAVLTAAELFWISTVRPDGRPHVTPLLAVWRDGGLHFCTGAGERKARNIASNPEVVLTTGTNTRRGGSPTRAR
jgi:nitroimidazol reductase NimA-like FMN-containing flavoprotein (pyridoxamine 5'-phosphate oxidase superfamily)